MATERPTVAMKIRPAAFTISITPIHRHGKSEWRCIELYGRRRSALYRSEFGCHGDGRRFGHFDGGNLTASITLNHDTTEDVLSIDTSGTVSLSAGMTVGSNVSVSGTVIGTITGNGTGINNLVVTFNSNATPARVQDLVRALKYTNNNSANPSTYSRTIQVTIQDAASGSNPAVSAASSVTVISQPQRCPGTR
jgi:hypothetical protein